MNTDLKEILKKYVKTVNCVRRYAPCGRADIANAIGLSWTAADNYIRDLNEKKVLHKDENGLYSVSPDIAYSAGIAIGTRSIKVSIVDFAFQPMDAQKLVDLHLEEFMEHLDPSREVICYSSAQALEKLTDLINHIIKIILDAFDQNGKTLFGITLAFPGAVDVQQQKIIDCPNIRCLAGKHVSMLVHGKLLTRMQEKNIALLIEHNAKAALIAEREHLYHDEDDTRRALADSPNIAIAYGGTGLGCGLSLRRLLQRGTRFAGELGHLMAPDFWVSNQETTWPGEQPLQAQCSCTCENCLEALIRQRVFGAGTLETYIERTQSEVLKRFKHDHEAEYKVFLQYVGYIINHLVNLLDLDVLIFNGRLFDEMDGLADRLNLLKGMYALPYTSDTCSVIMGWRRADIVAIGAAMEVFLINGGLETDVQW